MKSTKIMIILHSIIAFLFIFLLVNIIENPASLSLFCFAYMEPLAPILACVIIAVIEKKRIDIADKTEKKAFFIAKILSNILFLMFDLLSFALWGFLAALSEPIAD